MRSSISRSRATGGIAWSLRRTRAGLVLRAVGESDASAHAHRLPVCASACCAVLFGGACAGLGGAYLSLAYTPFWTEGMTAGRGWIALALVVFAAWRPGACWRAPICSAASRCCSSICRAAACRHPDRDPVDAPLSGDDPRAGADLVGIARAAASPRPPASASLPRNRLTQRNDPDRELHDRPPPPAARHRRLARRRCRARTRPR